MIAPVAGTSGGDAQNGPGYRLAATGRESAENARLSLLEEIYDEDPTDRT
jgi:hypothetical protein